MRRQVDTTEYIKKIQLGDAVYDYLREGMVLGRFKPGQFLDQKKICEELQVSRAPLRDALIKLELQGFIEIYPRKGVKIKKLSLKEIENIYKVLGALEAQCLLDVFYKLSQEDLALLKKLNEELYRTLEQGDSRTYYNLNIDFHNVYLNKWENPLAMKIVNPLKQRLNDFPSMKYFNECELSNLGDHKRFIHSIEVGNREGAASILINEHWSYDIYKQYFHKVYVLAENGDAEESH